MREVQYDPSLYSHATPSQVRAALRRHGWSVRKAVRDELLEIWHRPDSGMRDLVVLLDTSYADYGDRVFDVCVALGAVDGVPPHTILEQTRLADWDVARFRSKHPASDDGSIPLEAGEELHQSAYTAMIASANSAYSARPTHSSSRSKQVMEYKNGLRLGQSELGSYIVKILSPVRIASDPKVEQQSLFDSEPETPPFGRKVVETLARAVVAVRRAIDVADQKQSMSAFVDSVGEGVSANLLESIVGASAKGAAPVEVSVRWSAELPSIIAPPKIEFHPKDLNRIAAASQHFRKTFPTPDTELEGYVVKATRPGEPLFGEVIVAALVGGRLRQVLLTLEGKQFQEALAAMRRRSVVRYSGTLSIEGRSYLLRDAKEVTRSAWPEGGVDPVIDDESPPDPLVDRSSEPPTLTSGDLVTADSDVGRDVPDGEDVDPRKNE